MALVTAVPRFLPVAILSRFEFPDKFKEWLSYIAPAVLSALLAVSVAAPEGSIDISMRNQYLLAFLPTLAVAVFTKSLFYTLTIGILCMALLHRLAG